MAKLKVKHISTALLIIYILCIIPMILIGFCNFPAADDFSMALESHQTFQRTGNVFAALGHALYMGYWYYMNWTGYFFSAALTAMCPSIFTEGLYSLTTIIMLGGLTLGVFFFFDACVVKKLGLSKYYARILSVFTLLSMTQSMPRGTARNEAFYWYSGSINYCFMLGLGLLFMGLMLRLSEKRSTRLLVTTSVLGFLLGGANYMTALSLAVMSVAFTVFDVMGRRKNPSRQKSYIWIPAALNILGLILSMMAPGNSVRGAMLSSLNPIVAVVRSVYHVFDLCINQWLRWEVIVILAAVAVVSFSASGAVRITLKHPVLFSAFCFLMAAVNIVPPLYATGSFEAGRMVSIIWMQFVLVMVLIVMYTSVFLGQLLRSGKAKGALGSLGDMATGALFTLVAVLAVGLLLSAYVDRHYLTSISAAYDLANGNAATYASENRHRLEILKNREVSEAELPEHTVKPELLYFSDVTENPQDWVNEAVAEYYEKTSVRLLR